MMRAYQRGYRAAPLRLVAILAILTSLPVTTAVGPCLSIQFVRPLVRAMLVPGGEGMNGPIHSAARVRPAATTLGLLALLVVALLAVAGPALAGAPTTNIPYDGTVDLRPYVPVQHYPADAPSSALLGATSLHDGRAPDITLTLYDSTSGHAGPYDVPFWREYSGAHSDIYVGWDDLAAPAASTQQDQTITADQIQYIGKEFDQHIWETDVFHFGNYAPRPADDPAKGKRAAIFIHNIRDDAYWTSYRYYIAGYFSSGLNDEIQQNAIFVDSFNWADRLGDQTSTPSHNYLYEGTVAHEFQHLIHHDVDADESDFINEGMSDLAEQFNYGTLGTSSHIGEYLYYHRDSLTGWNGELADYGSSVLWQDYLWENAGGKKLTTALADRVAPGYENNKFAETDAKFTDPGDAFIWNQIHDQKNGMDGVADQVGGMDKVKALFHNWTLANLLDGKATQARWNYRNLVLNGIDSANMTVDQGLAYYSSNVNGNVPPTRKNVRRNTSTEPWGAYYRTYGGSEPGFTMTFTGEKQTGIAPPTGQYEWYSGQGNMLERTVERTIAGVQPGDELTFKTWFNIEQDWDYGWVEGSTDGVTWTKLTQLSALPSATANINGSTKWESPGALTGTSNGWQDARFSMGALTGSVHLRFRYSTDEGYNEQGWYVDDVKLGAFTDNVDSVNGWVTDAADGWLFTTGQQDNDWTVDAYVPFAKGGAKGYQVIPVVDVAGLGTDGKVYVAAQHQKNAKVYGVASNAPNGSFLALGKLSLLKGK
jgi:hypothetical protein